MVQNQFVENVIDMTYQVVNGMPFYIGQLQKTTDVWQSCHGIVCQLFLENEKAKDEIHLFVPTREDLLK